MAGETRGRPGRIQALPPEIKAYVDRRLREGATQAAVVEETRDMLAGLDQPPLSRSGLNRYATRMEQVGRRIREARAAADAWTARFGEAPSGAVGQHIVEMLRTMAWDWSLEAGEADGPVDPETLNQMALAVRRLEQAAAVGEERERRMRREIAEEAAQAAGEEARQAGAPLPPEALQRIREQVYGIYET